jgi:hypothetical protein
MTNLSVFDFDGHQIRWIDGKPVANDVAAALGYADPSKTVSTKVFNQNKSVTKTVTVDGKYRSVTVLEEPGIYQLIFGSKLESAQAFQNWVFEKVLPEIRKTGGYGKQTHNLEWFDRLKLYRAKTNLPTGWFSIFEEMTLGLMADFEEAGYALPMSSVPDISVGKCFCNHLRGIGVDTKDPGKIRKYLHHYPDGRKVDANIYSDSLLPEYRRWFKDTYRTRHLPQYLKGKDPNALPSLCGILGLPEGSE